MQPGYTARMFAVMTAVGSKTFRFTGLFGGIQSKSGRPKREENQENGSRLERQGGAGNRGGEGVRCRRRVGGCAGGSSRGGELRPLRQGGGGGCERSESHGSAFRGCPGGCGKSCRGSENVPADQRAIWTARRPGQQRRSG